MEITEDYLKQLSDEELEKLYKLTKSEMEYQDSLSLAYKIFLNSQYGAGALVHNPYSNGKLTNASVTITGRMWVQLTGMVLSNKIRELLGEEPTCELTEVVQGDTDSQYLSLDRLINKELPNASEEEILDWIQNFYKTELKPEIDKLINKMANQFNFRLKDILKMDQEVITTSFCSVASKRYFCRVKINDGNILAKPKEKVTGVSLVSKSTPREVKKILKPILGYILDHNEFGMQEYISNKFKEFGSLPAHELSRASSVSSIDNWQYVTKDNRPIDWFHASKLAKFENGKWQTAPINSKGSVVLNTLIDVNNLEAKYEKIGNFDKIFFTYLQVPNIITGNNNVLAFKDPGIFDDLKLNEYIDYDTQWEKEVINKVKILTDTVGWSIERKASLDDW